MNTFRASFVPPQPDSLFISLITSNPYELLRPELLRFPIILIYKSTNLKDSHPAVQQGFVELSIEFTQWQNNFYFLPVH